MKGSCAVFFSCNTRGICTLGGSSENVFFYNKQAFINEVLYLWKRNQLHLDPKFMQTTKSRFHPTTPQRRSRSLEEILGNRTLSPWANLSKCTPPNPKQESQTWICHQRSKQRPPPHPLSLSQPVYQHPATVKGLGSRDKILESSRSKPSG